MNKPLPLFLFRYLMVLSTCFLSLSIFSQQNYHSQSNYDSAIGIRLTNGYGLSAKFGMPYEGHYIEAISYFAGYTESNLVNLTALYELSLPLTKNLNFYYGLGPGVNLLIDAEEADLFQFSVNGILGLEFIFKEAPFAVSLDYLGNYSFEQPKNVYYGNGFGLTARWILK